MTFAFLKGEVLVGQKLVLVKVNEATEKIYVILWNKETVTATPSWLLTINSVTYILVLCSVWSTGLQNLETTTKSFRKGNLESAAITNGFLFALWKHAPPI